jgi:hypothetical protein
VLLLHGFTGSPGFDTPVG